MRWRTAQRCETVAPAGRFPRFRPRGRIRCSGKADVRVGFVASEGTSPFGPSWKEVMEQIARRLKWSSPAFMTSVVDCTEQPQLRSRAPDLLLFAGVQDAELRAEWLEALREEKSPNVVITAGDSDAAFAVSVNGFDPLRPSPLQRIAAWIPGTEEKRVAEISAALGKVWTRQTSDDIVYALQFATHQFLKRLPEMTDLSPDLEAAKCIGRHCRQEVLSCLLNPQCRRALDCLNVCGIHDQVCSYRCIVSYESELLERFSFCILQKHNCLRNTVSIPALPEVSPMGSYRGEALRHDVAAEILMGHLGELGWSWKVVLGKNPAYDYFPCQFQLFYPGKGRGSMWYDPVFQVVTLDGRRVWRRRHYRVRRASLPGSFFFSVLDNGVTSNEYWRIVDADATLCWALFYYSGAAAAAGISYTGAVLATPDGRLPPAEMMPRVCEGLRRCGIEMWETSRVDYSCCDNPPLTPVVDVT